MLIIFHLCPAILVYNELLRRKINEPISLFPKGFSSAWSCETACGWSGTETDLIINLLLLKPAEETAAQCFHCSPSFTMAELWIFRKFVFQIANRQPAHITIWTWACSYIFLWSFLLYKANCKPFRSLYIPCFTSQKAVGFFKEFFGSLDMKIPSLILLLLNTWKLITIAINSSCLAHVIFTFILCQFWCDYIDLEF